MQLRHLQYGEMDLNKITYNPAIDSPINIINKGLLKTHGANDDIRFLCICFPLPVPLVCLLHKIGKQYF